MSGSGTIYTEQAVLGHTLGFAPMAFPAQVYVGLCSAAMPPSETVQGVEAFGNGYMRMQARFALIDTPANIAANVATVEYPRASGGWGTLGFFELWDAPSGGNRLYWGALIDTSSQLPITITVGSGDIVRFSAGTLAVQAATGSGGTGSVGAYLPLAGGTLTGPLLLASDPTNYLQAATKQYVDAHSGTGGGPGFLPLSGGTMLGPLALAGNATAPLQAVPLQQVDTLNVVNVLNHGAKGDGTTNDTTAIQGVLNTYAGKAVVFIPDTGSNYMVGALTVPSGTDLLIHGKLLFNQSGGSMLYVQNVSNVTVRGHGVLDGNGPTSAGSQAVFYVYNSTNVQLSGLTLQNSYDWNLNVVGSSNVHVDSVRLLNGRTSNEFAAGCSHCWITNSYITGVTSDESFSFYSGCTNCGITNCEVSYGFISGISVYADPPGQQSLACSDITISNNIVHHCGEGGIEVRTGAGGATNLHQNITITGNRCYSNATNSTFGEIWLESGNNITVTGNALSNTGTASHAGCMGILVGSGTSHVTITGNSIWNIGQGSTNGAGIYLQSAPNVLIEGNHIYDNQGTPTMQTAFTGSAGINTAIIGNSYTGVPSGLGFGPGGAALATDTIVASIESGKWTVGAPKGASVNSAISASNGFSATLEYDSNAGPRWRVGTDGVVESGSNVGTNYTIARYSDANALLGTPVSISRATGSVTLSQPLYINNAQGISYNGNNPIAFNWTGTALTLVVNVTNEGTLLTDLYMSTRPNAANDAAAATAGVPVGGVYRNASVLMVRTV